MASDDTITERIIDAKRSIRKKLFELKRGVDESNNYIRAHMAPIVKPLKELVDKTVANDEQQQQQQQQQRFSTKLDNSTVSLNDTLLSNAWLESDEYDRVYGIRLDEEGQYVMGDKQVVIDEEKETIKVGALKKCSFTKGLQEILFKSHPRVGYFDKNDLKMYKCFLLHTRCHRNSSGKLKANAGFKYKYIVGPLFKQDGQDITKLYNRLKTQTGQGLSDPYVSVTDKTKEYVYWDDPNELVRRLTFLHATKRAGNTGVDNEILAVEEELREIGVIL